MPGGPSYTCSILHVHCNAAANDMPTGSEQYLLILSEICVGLPKVPEINHHLDGPLKTFRDRSPRACLHSTRKRGNFSNLSH